MKFKRYIKESIYDMDKRCPECNTLLNDGGTCPKCDDGEEDYGDEATKYIEDNCKKPLVETMSNLEKLKAAYPDLNFDEPMTEEVVIEDLSNWEKLTRAYPELAIEEPLTESCVEEELTNSQKLKRAFPELNFEESVVEEVKSDEHLHEAAGSDTVHVVGDALKILANDDTKQWAKTAGEIVNIIPDNLADELFDKVKSVCANIKLKGSTKNSVSRQIGTEINDSNDTVGELFEIAEENNIKQDAELTKALLMTVLAAVAIIEPTPVLEVITLIIGVVPAEVLHKIVTMLNSLNPATVVGKKIAELISSKLTKPDSANDSKETVEEALDDHYIDYDDDYDFDDDVEQDRVHAALYGGDRTYCDCGRKLEYGEDGFAYCPDCDNEFNYDDNID